MNAEIEKLLALLDDENAFGHSVAVLNLQKINENWATLAFRLRDEAVRTHWLYWHKAMQIIRDHRSDFYSKGVDVWGDYARPQDFIIAALVARLLKEQTKP